MSSPPSSKLTRYCLCSHTLGDMALIESGLPTRVHSLGETWLCWQPPTTKCSSGRGGALCLSLLVLILSGWSQHRYNVSLIFFYVCPFEGWWHTERSSGKSTGFIWLSVTILIKTRVSAWRSFISQVTAVWHSEWDNPVGRSVWTLGNRERHHCHRSLPPAGNHCF